MILAELQRGDSPTVDASFKNEGAATISLGNAAAFPLTAASFDGNIVINVAGATVGFAGIALKDVASGSHGLFRVFGAVDSVLISHVGTSITVTVGDALVPGAGSGGLFSGAPDIASGFNYVHARSTSVAISAASYVKGFVKCI